MRRRSFAALLAGAALLVGACGGGSSSPSEAVAAASANTQGEGSAKVSLNTVTSIPEALAGGGPTEIPIGGGGAVDYENQTGEMTLDMSGLTGAGAPQMGDMHMVFEGTRVYMQFDLLTQQLPDGKSWVTFDIQEVGEELGVDVSQFTQFSNNDPTAALQYLEGATDLKEVGSDEVRGVETTHYKGEVDLQDVVDRADNEEYAKAVEQIIEVTKLKSFPLDVWVDDDELLRRMRYSVEVPAGPGGEAITNTMTMELYDFGTEVEIEVPSEDETVELQDVLGGGAP